MLSNRVQKGEDGTLSRDRPVRRAKSAIVISKSMNNKQRATTTDNKQITIRNKSQLSTNRDKSHDTPRKQPRSARSSRSARSTDRHRKKLTAEEKERKKERSADIKKLKSVFFFYFLYLVSIFIFSISLYFFFFSKNICWFFFIVIIIIFEGNWNKQKKSAK